MKIDSNKQYTEFKKKLYDTINDFIIEDQSMIGRKMDHAISCSLGISSSLLAIIHKAENNDITAEELAKECRESIMDRVDSAFENSAKFLILDKNFKITKEPE